MLKLNVITIYNKAMHLMISSPAITVMEQLDSKRSSFVCIHQVIKIIQI